MSDINNRIRLIVEDSGLTKTAFAKRINVSQGLVSQICNGITNPSDRTINDICKEFSINENWIRHGEGPMKKPVSRGDEIERFMSFLDNERESFRSRLITALTRLDEKEWELLESMALKLADETRPESTKAGKKIIKIAGRDGSMEELALTDEDENEYLERIDQLPDAGDDI